ncbi:oxidoreductase [Beijerinckiaceae bacterium]|nr:oxidoreductase [Beijerinckiaceae bacterium]
MPSTPSQSARFNWREFLAKFLSKPGTQRPPTAINTGSRQKTMSCTLTINGEDHRLVLDPRTSLLDALREHLALTGTKKGCDHGQCGACTVHVDGRNVLSCLILAVATQGHPITTIEGLADSDGSLHPMQQAFIDQDALQCGYCTPGQIMSAIVCVQSGQATSPDAIREYMSGNLCRCAAYPNIVTAIQQAKGKMEVRPSLEH